MEPYSNLRLALGSELFFKKINIISFVNYPFAIYNLHCNRRWSSGSELFSSPISGTTAHLRGSIWIRTVASILCAGSFVHLWNIQCCFLTGSFRSSLRDHTSYFLQHHCSWKQTNTMIIIISSFSLILRSRPGVWQKCQQFSGGLFWWKLIMCSQWSPRIENKTVTLGSHLIGGTSYIVSQLRISN